MQRDERDLPDVGRLAGHVGAGEQHDLASSPASRVSLGTKAALAPRASGVGRTQHLLDDGMAAFGDFEHVAVVELGRQ
jgi:hypothetical protein